MSVHADSPLNRGVIEYYGKGIDISRGGILFVSMADFKPSASCFIKLQRVDGTNLEKKGVIVRAQGDTALKEKESYFALQFNEPLSDEDFSSIVPA